MQYLRGSTDKCLKFNQLKSNARLIGNVNIDYTGDLDKKRFVLVMCFGYQDVQLIRRQHYIFHLVVYN